MTNAFHNTATAQLADDYGLLKLQADALAKRLDDIKAELKKRTGGDETVEGAKFAVTVATSERVTYDDKAIREALGSDICEQYKRTTETVTLRVKPIVVFEQAA